MVRKSDPKKSTVTRAAPKCDGSPNKHIKRKGRRIDCSKQVIQDDTNFVDTSGVRELKKHNCALENVLWKMTNENEILQDAVELTQPK